MQITDRDDEVSQYRQIAILEVAHGCTHIRADQRSVHRCGAFALLTRDGDVTAGAPDAVGAAIHRSGRCISQNRLAMLQFSVLARGCSNTLLGCCRRSVMVSRVVSDHADTAV